MITFDEFKKIDLRVARVLEAERVEGSDKLLKLKVGAGQIPPVTEGAESQQDIRQIIAGIGKIYAPEQLIGKLIVVVANLEPRMIMGLESQGMVVAANDGGPVIIQPEKEVAPGTKLQ